MDLLLINQSHYNMTPGDSACLMNESELAEFEKEKLFRGYNQDISSPGTHTHTRCFSSSELWNVTETNAAVYKSE